MAVRSSTVYVVDMGGWQRNRGRLLAFGQNGHEAGKVLLTGLDRPSGLVFASDGQLYIGLPDRVLRVVLHDNGSAETREVLTDLPSVGRHPLKALAADHDGGLYVSEGSATNNCETASGGLPVASQACPETQGKVPRASILWFRPNDKPQPASAATVVATGMRNPAALTVMPNGVLLAAVNGRDSINAVDPKLSDETLPHEPFLVVQKGKDYGWPYCFDDRKPAPEYPKHDCSGVTPPDLLLPAHAAPLGMLVYSGRAFPELQNKILIAYHGYRDTGHRVMSLTINPDGKPQGSPQPLVQGWRNLTQPGSDPTGSPVGLAVMADGTLLISEDHNGTVLRLAPDRSAGHH
ncbi:PQQ-dependent sugar dehydrogenase [Acetobacter sp.]|uniref:PQQ-dependent sugar dehydrogenase n=1 Tax=Acetobacter sp. TaxID=440 RepID=UPI0025C304C1|nr:PQQ-dependent sugar dehydrogenase [Acetobacter sp.]MCH4091433.1 PQQ-dependent sugar dehydrogenase [Acetobacter sp.]MCI1299411.1 PQQ-dependent sugar dehydrogenase [Acetobacter sp.]MCI1316585.1 PQQ-dependent sugar dehydrogenase [Acetobacter sp.]